MSSLDEINSLGGKEIYSFKCSVQRSATNLPPNENNYHCLAMSNFHNFSIYKPLLVSSDLFAIISGCWP